MVEIAMAQPDADAGEVRDDAGEVRAGASVRRRLRMIAAHVTTGLACLLVLFALIAPNQIRSFTPGAFVRIPVEGLVGVALFLVLPARARRVVAALAGAALGLLTLVKIVDMGFYEVLD
ncbi:MAG TPA: sulfatase, partial [Pilimelia sp.]|nr:sulfatase [Pilimelia sp.]